MEMSDETQQRLRDAVQGVIGMSGYVLVVDTTELGEEEHASMVTIAEPHASTFTMIGLLDCARKGLVG